MITYCSWAVEYRDPQRWALSKGRLAWRDMNPWKQGATASRPAGESPRELEPRLPRPRERGLAWLVRHLGRLPSPHRLAVLMQPLHEGLSAQFPGQPAPGACSGPPGEPFCLFCVRAAREATIPTCPEHGGTGPGSPGEEVAVPGFGLRSNSKSFHVVTLQTGPSRWFSLVPDLKWQAARVRFPRTAQQSTR